MSLINKIRCAINCLRGKPTIYGVMVMEGTITVKVDSIYIMECDFYNGSGIAINSTHDNSRDE